MLNARLLERRMDLLTVIYRELGHAIGLEHGEVSAGRQM